MHPASVSFIGQILRPAGPTPGLVAPAAAPARRVTPEQIVLPRGPGALVSEETVRVDDVAILPPAAV